MARNGFFTGLDIGTSSIKVLVAEYVNKAMNVIGVSNVPSAGVKDGIIVDIETAATAIREAIEQAEEKSGVTIDKVNVGLPANLLQIESTQGMIPIPSESKEIRDEDVESIVKSALTKSITPEREVISLVPEEFVVDGFQGIRDPRGMMGLRLEMRGLLYTGPTTILHNLRTTVERAGIKAENIIISPLALTRSVLNEGEREFGATVIDMGGGQTTVASMKSQELEYTNIYPEGGDYVTKDISKVLKTSHEIAEALKFNFGTANLAEASDSESVQVEVVGSDQPIQVTERYLSQIISARVRHILERVKQDMDRGRLAELPGGVVIVGGAAILPGVVELAQEIFGAKVKLHVPNQVGIRNPMFANVISLVEFVGTMTDVDIIAQQVVRGEEIMRKQPIEPTPVRQTIQQALRRENPVGASPIQPNNESDYLFEENPVQEPQATFRNPEPVSEPKQKFTDRVRGIFGSMFD